MEAFIGVILPWAGTYAPRGWLFCNGQQLQINQYQALYAVIGFQYGGDGKTVFNLPNLNGRVPVCADMGGQRDAGISSYSNGSKGGTEQTTLSINNLPRHNHLFSSAGGILKNANATVAIPVVNNDGTTNIPDDNSTLGKGISNGRDANIYSKNTSNGTLKSFDAPVTGDVSISGIIGETGSGTSFDNRQPYLAVNYIICIEGLYPPRP